MSYSQRSSLGQVRNKTELDCQFAFYSASDPDSYTMIFERDEGYTVDASCEGFSSSL